MKELLDKFRRGRPTRLKSTGQELGFIGGTALISRVVRGKKNTVLQVNLLGFDQTYYHDQLEVFNGRKKVWE